MTDYPHEWHTGDIQARIRERAEHRCEHCGMVFAPGTNMAIHERNRDGLPVVGTVHHLSGDKSDCSYANLVYLCQRCHLHVQSVWKPGAMLPPAWGGVPKWITRRGLAYQEPPRQLALFEEVRQ